MIDAVTDGVLNVTVTFDQPVTLVSIPTGWFAASGGTPVNATQIDATHIELRVFPAFADGIPFAYTEDGSITADSGDELRGGIVVCHT